MWAPSAHNRQPWRWLVLQQEQDKLALAEAMGADLMRARLADGDDPQVIEQDVQRSIDRISGAPVVMVACLDTTDLDHYPDAERQQAEYIMAVQSVAMAAQNLMLLAHAEGLGTCWMCAPLFSPTSVQGTFELPQGWIPQGLILMGVPEASGREKARKALREVIRWI